MSYRIEHDTFGEIKVPADKFWAAQTERSRQNFPVGKEKMPIEVIVAFAQLKRAAAIVNFDLGKLSEAKKDAIVHATDKIIRRELDEHFPLVVWQTGSGTQSNMNVNEVVAHVANDYLKEKGIDEVVHPNDDVNKSQSSNDTFPTAMYVALMTEAEVTLLPALKKLRDTFKEKEEKFQEIIKIGRTHLQDATPLSLGQEVSGWRYSLDKALEMINESKQQLSHLAIGGTAVGTGLNAHPEFGEKVAKQIAKQTGYDFVSSENKFHALSQYDEVVYFHGALKALAGDVLKIVNDIRWLASGPRAGIGEITIPENEPGSSIMPGKVNPVMAEVLNQIAFQVIGNDNTISLASEAGQFELNVMEPVLAFNLIQSIDIMNNGFKVFTERCIAGITANEEQMKSYVENSIGVITALVPHIGYKKASAIAVEAIQTGQPVRQLCSKHEVLTEEQLDHVLNAFEMTNIGVSKLPE